MACGCKNKQQKFVVQLPGGTKLTKTTLVAATAFAAKHPGSKVLGGAAA